MKKFIIAALLSLSACAPATTNMDVVGHTLWWAEHRVDHLLDVAEAHGLLDKALGKQIIASKWFTVKFNMAANYLRVNPMKFYGNVIEAKDECAFDRMIIYTLILETNPPNHILAQSNPNPFTHDATYNWIATFNPKEDFDKYPEWQKVAEEVCGD